MSPTRFPRCLALAGLVLALAACVPATVRTGADASLLAGQAAHEAALAAEPDWRLQGRLAVSAGGDGGSGRIDWVQRGDSYDIKLSAPVTRASWRLQGGPAQARLDGLDGGPLAGPDARRLLADATGWDIPVQALSHWVRGGRAPGQAHIEFGPDGLPALIVQQGWSVEYRGWTAGPSPRPKRVFATRQDASVRLAVDAWEAP
ncbi:outer-membrane lipoprotein LolB [Arenimonas soli]|uniref:Outer-membrane lipoprotein LolB n=1 Tax=Arenimonas soli TaxID=2269504 RepID=A0ABQ1HS25_9GAMM|nr:lipoprotein insertase outer membrane protein LolB [Arenimonas soli]GGA86637.1 outer-membrane lipoprotein LolB [Arenimonas soli]